MSFMISFMIIMRARCVGDIRSSKDLSLVFMFFLRCIVICMNYVSVV